MTFEELKLCPPLLRAVAAAGYTRPSPIQAKAIPPVLAGRDLMGCAQTGTGKTAAFALPMLQRLSSRPSPAGGRPIRALILTPTRELALQIDESFAAYGREMKLRHTVVFGGVGQAPQVAALQSGVDILVACPGRLNDLIGQGLADLSHVEIFVLDEADRMLDMGFVHDVKKVIAKLPAQRQNLMFSATMPKEIEELAGSILRRPAFVKVDPVSSTVDKIQQSLYFVSKADKRHLLPHLIRTLTPPVENALVFSRTKHGADRIARDLQREGISAAAIHGNKSQSARVAALEGFKSGKTQVLVATDIAARGIDINELAYVFNFDLPEVPETYVHRIGRTARAGADGCAVSFCAPEEREYLAGIEKLNRKKIPVVTGHPWDGASGEPAPAPVETVPVRVARSERIAHAAPAPAQEKDVEANREEASEAMPMKENDRSGRRRRRGKGNGSAAQQPEKAAQQQPKAAQTQQAKPQQQQSRGSRAAKEQTAAPAFDPHFLPGAPAQPQRGRSQAAQKPEGRAAQKQESGRSQKQESRAQKQEAARAQKPERESRNAQKQGSARGQRNDRADRSDRGRSAERPEQESARGQKQEREAARAQRQEPKQSRHAKAAVQQEDTGLVLISRRPPQQRFTSFEEYIQAHGGVTAPVDDYAQD